MEGIRNRSAPPCGFENEEEIDGGGRNVKEDVERIFLDKWLSRPKRKQRERAEKDECTRWSVEWPFYRHEMHFLSKGVQKGTPFLQDELNSINVAHLGPSHCSDKD